MMRLRLLAMFAIAAISSACASTDTGPGSPDEAIEEDFNERRQQAIRDEQRRRQLPRLIIETLGPQIRKYHATLFNSGSPNAEKERDKFRRFLVQEANANLDTLLLAANDASSPLFRSTACAALGFANDKSRVLNSLVQAAQAEDQGVQSHAIFGLGVLQESRTPVGPLLRAIEDPSRSDSDRGGAAWSLYQVQSVAVDKEPFIAAWASLLEGDLTSQPAEVTLSAVRGLGQAKATGHRETVERYLLHPFAKVRMTAAVALGRMMDPAAAPAMIDRLERGESNNNVRMCLRGGLSALAGNRYAGFDVDEWRRIFDLGSDPVSRDG